MHYRSPRQQKQRHTRIAMALVCTAALQCGSMTAARADPTPVAQVEIDHLLDFVAQSQCTFIRNGTEHKAAEAKTHMSEKFAYVRKRISTAEDFIKGVASESSLSGEPYRVRCGKTELLARAWLSDELRRFRSKP